MCYEENIDADDNNTQQDWHQSIDKAVSEVSHDGFRRRKGDSWDGGERKLKSLKTSIIEIKVFLNF